VYNFFVRAAFIYIGNLLKSSAIICSKYNSFREENGGGGEGGVAFLCEKDEIGVQQPLLFASPALSLSLLGG